MESDPYSMLELSPDSTDEAIRRQYLRLVRTYTPEREPERFAAIRAAYEKLRDPTTRLRYQLFEAGKDEDLEALITDAKATRSPRRVPVAELLDLGQRRS